MLLYNPHSVFKSVNFMRHDMVEYYHNSIIEDINKSESYTYRHRKYYYSKYFSLGYHCHSYKYFLKNDFKLVIDPEDMFDCNIWYVNINYTRDEICLLSKDCDVYHEYGFNWMPTSANVISRYFRIFKRWKIKLGSLRYNDDYRGRDLFKYSDGDDIEF